MEKTKEDHPDENEDNKVVVEDNFKEVMISFVSIKLVKQLTTLTTNHLINSQDLKTCKVFHAINKVYY